MIVKNIVDLLIEHKRPEEKTDFTSETAFVEFHEGALLEGYAIVYVSEIDDYVHKDFSIAFHTDFNDVFYGNHEYYTNISEIECFWWNETTGMFNAGGAVGFAVHLNSAKLCIEDTFALKSDLNDYKLKSNTTITHYAPIEAGENIDDFMIGRPVFISGHVYKLVDGAKWVSSTANDTTDCICSVVHKGTWKEFNGVITSIDVDNKCVTFASHGDYLFYVDDSNIYAIGDVLLYDGRILDEDYAMTLRIQQSMVGKVTAKINEHMIALFKE